MVLNGCEMFDESTMEACGLHNNASVEMVELDVWSGMLEMRLDAPSSTRQKIGAVGAAMNKVKLPTPPPPLPTPPSSSTPQLNTSSNTTSTSATSSSSSLINKKGHLLSFGVGRGEMPTPHPPDPKFIALLQADGNPKVLQSKKFKTSSLNDTKTGATTGNNGNVNHGLNKKKTIGAVNSGGVSGVGERVEVGTVSNAMVNLKIKLKTGGKGWEPPYDTY